MNRKLFAAGAGVIVDVCRAHGTFFDAGELPAIIEFVMQGGLEKAQRKELERQREQLRRERAAVRDAQHDAARSHSHFAAGDTSGAAGALVDLLACCSALMRALVVIAAIAACKGDRAAEPRTAGTQIEVTTSAPGWNASNVELSITNLLERELAQLQHVRTIHSTSSDGRSIVTIGFDGDDALAIADRVRRAVPTTMLPTDVLMPTVSFASGPIALRYVVRWIGVRDIDAATVHRTKIYPELERIDGVARIETCGESDARVEVRIDLERLAARGSTIASVVAAVRSARDLRRIDALRSLETTEQIRLGDVADVVETAAPAECHAAARGGPAIEGIVYVQARADVAAVRTAGTRALHDAAATLPRGVLADAFVPLHEYAIELPPGADAEARELVAARAAKALGQRDALVELRADRVRALVADSYGVTLFAQALPGTRVVEDDGSGTSDPRERRRRRRASRRTRARDDRGRDRARRVDRRARARAGRTVPRDRVRPGCGCGRRRRCSRHRRYDLRDHRRRVCDDDPLRPVARGRRARDREGARRSSARARAGKRRPRAAVIRRARDPAPAAARDRARSDVPVRLAARALRRCRRAPRAARGAREARDAFNYRDPARRRHRNAHVAVAGWVESIS